MQRRGAPLPSQTGSVPPASPAQPSGGRPTAGPIAGGALEGGCPEQERPQSMSFPLFPELTQQGRKSGAKTWP